MMRHIARVLALILAIGAAPAAGRAAAPLPAADADGVLEAAVGGALTLVGEIGPPRKIDVHGYVADLHVDELLQPDGARIAVGDTIRIAWEELSASRPVRFHDRERILVCLAAVPSQSLWKRRFPEPDERARTRVIANRGGAFLRSPDAVTVDLLRHYLAADPEGRTDPAALVYLVDLVAVAPVGLADEALTRLAAVERIGSKLATDSQAALARSARLAERPRALRERTLLVVGALELGGARDAVVELTAEGSDVRPTAFLVLGQLDDGLPQEQVHLLLASDQPELRSVGAIYLSGPDARAMLTALVREDPSADVRLAVVGLLVGRYGAEAFEQVAPALAEPDDAVRAAAARTIGSIGEPVVPQLVALVDTGSERAAGGAVIALAFAGQGGAVALDKIGREHPDEKLRLLAELAQGRLPGHKH